MSPLAGTILYGLAWASFGLGHSLLAAARGRAWLVRRFGPAHRVAYNAIALVHITAVWAVGWAVLDDLPAFDLPRPMVWTMHGLAVAGLIFGGWALRYYDRGRLIGTRQLQAARSGTPEAEDEQLRLDGPHRWVRHPLYLAGFLILWGRAFDPFGLATALWGSAYLIVGTWHEERALMTLYGPAYAAYRAKVPAFLPWKGRAWRD